MAKRRPKASTLKAILTPGRISIRLHTIFCPPRTTGSIEAIIPNFINAITNVQVSLKFGFLYETIIRMGQKNERAIATIGLRDVTVSIR